MNHVDEEIHETIQKYVAEAEKANVSRDMQEQQRRIQAVLDKNSPLDVLASGHVMSLHDQARLMAIREAVLELAKIVKTQLLVKTPKPAPVQSSPVESSAVEQTDIEAAIEEAPTPKKRGRKPKVAA